MKISLCSFLFVLAFFWAFSQEKNYTAIDDYVYDIRVEGLDLVQITDSLTNRFASDEAKTRAIFTWITTNIAYDCAGANARDSLAQQVEEADRLYSTRSRLRLILKNRRALCGGFTFLFRIMCELAGIPCRPVEGRARGGSRATDGHAWNAVLIDGQWRWLDATWASGTCQGRQFLRQHREEYFLQPPERMRRSHVPHEYSWDWETNEPKQSKKD